MRASTDFIDFAWGALKMHCGSVRSVGSVACVKSFEMLHFSDSDRSVGQSDCGYANTLLWRYLDSRKHVDMSKSRPAAGDLKM